MQRPSKHWINFKMPSNLSLSSPEACFFCGKLLYSKNTQKGSIRPAGDCTVYGRSSPRNKLTSLHLNSFALIAVNSREIFRANKDANKKITHYNDTITNMLEIYESRFWVNWMNEWMNDGGPLQFSLSSFSPFQACHI